MKFENFVKRHAEMLSDIEEYERMEIYNRRMRGMAKVLKYIGVTDEIVNYKDKPSIGLADGSFFSIWPSSDGLFYMEIRRGEYLSELETKGFHDFVSPNRAFVLRSWIYDFLMTQQLDWLYD